METSNTVSKHTENPDQTVDDTEQAAIGLVAMFDKVDAAIAALKSVKQKGWGMSVDVHSPHPIHGLDELLEARRSPLPIAAALGAIAGLAGGLWMAWWMNAIDYPFIISGKPLFAVVPSFPIAFELAILLAAFAVFFGALALSGLPRLSNPLSRVPVFARVTNDRYAMAISGSDFEEREEELRRVLQASGAQDFELIRVVPEERIPSIFTYAAVTAGVLALVPLALIAKARTEVSDQPRLSFISDMDHQPKAKAQTTSPLFADGRAARPDVPGTIPRGDLREDDRLYRGLKSADRSDEMVDASGGTESLALVSLLQSGGNAAETTPNWTTQIPLEVTTEFVNRGRERYGIFCATCHGIAGDGDGLVTLRALELEQGTWVRPTSLHDERIRNQPVGQHYNIIANGVRKMPGYADQIPVEDRWAIVAYIRALQRTRTSDADDVPPSRLSTFRELN